MAGVSRLQYANEIRLIRVMCSGRVDLEFILRSFFNGMDGVFIGGCHLGECNYITHGNYRALTTVLLAKKILEYIGLNPDRLRIEFMSSGEGIVFTEVVDDFTKQVRELGPRGSDGGASADEIRSRIEAVTKLIPYIKIAKREKLEARLQDQSEYADYFTSQEVEDLLNNPVSYYIDPEKCMACMTCARRCPADAIISAKNQIHVIDQEKCIKCGTCYDACPTKFSAVTKLIGEPVPPPLPEDQRTVVRKKKTA